MRKLHLIFIRSSANCRALEVCIELNIREGVIFHERLAILRLNEDQQARYINLCGILFPMLLVCMLALHLGNVS